MSQVQIFEIDTEEEDEEIYNPRRPKYSTIVTEEEYEDDEGDEEEIKGWDFTEDKFFLLQ